jgi:transposase
MWTHAGRAAAGEDQPHKRGLNSKLHLAVDEYGIPASDSVTNGTVADCSQTPLLMDGLEAEAFLADKTYDTNELLGMLKEADIAAVIPPVKSRKEQRAYSHELYRARHIIENVFRALKHQRGTAARYAKPAASFIAAIHIRCFPLHSSSSPHYLADTGNNWYKALKDTTVIYGVDKGWFNGVAVTQ